MKDESDKEISETVNSEKEYTHFFIEDDADEKLFILSLILSIIIHYIMIVTLTNIMY